MREIKFRAWNSSTEEMVDFGDLFCKQGHFDALVNTLATGTAAYNSDSQTYILMQYTGLKDKNGVEIYDGDIVHDHYFKNSVSRHKVYWADSFGCWSTINLKDPIVDRKQLGYFNEAKNLHRNEYLEVIGNIYENPELLKEVKE